MRLAWLVWLLVLQLFPSPPPPPCMPALTGLSLVQAQAELHRRGVHTWQVRLVPGQPPSRICGQDPVADAPIGSPPLLYLGIAAGPSPAASAPGAPQARSGGIAPWLLFFLGQGGLLGLAWWGLGQVRALDRTQPQMPALSRPTPKGRQTLR